MKAKYVSYWLTAATCIKPLTSDSLIITESYLNQHWCKRAVVQHNIKVTLTTTGAVIHVSC